MNQEVKIINGYSIKDEKAIRTYDSVALMKSDRKLKEGQHVKTRGYYSINDGGSAEYYITDTQSQSDYQENLENGLYATLIINDELNVLQIGVIENVDITTNLQRLLNILNNKKLYINDIDILVSDSLILPNNLKIEGNGKIKLNGDIDYLLYNNGANEVINIEIKGLSFEKIDNDFTKLNRFIYVNGGYLTVSNCNFKNYGTAIHHNEGEKLIAKHNNFENAYGILAQYGYGINTSSKFDEINDNIFINQDNTTGRHCLYINGEIKKISNIKKIYVENWHHNPIEIHLDDYQEQPIINIENCTFKNCTIEATGSTPTAGIGTINITQTSYGIVNINNVKQYDLVNCIIYSRSQNGSLNINNVDCDCETATSSEKQVIFLRYGYNHRINNVNVKSMGTNFDSILYCRENSTPIIVNNIFTEESTIGNSIITSNNSEVYNGFIYGSITHLRTVGTGTISPLTTS